MNEFIATLCGVCFAIVLASAYAVGHVQGRDEGMIAVTEHRAACVKDAEWECDYVVQARKQP